MCQSANSPFRHGLLSQISCTTGTKCGSFVAVYAECADTPVCCSRQARFVLGSVPYLAPLASSLPLHVSSCVFSSIVREPVARNLQTYLPIPVWNCRIRNISSELASKLLVRIVFSIRIAQ